MAANSPSMPPFKNFNRQNLSLYRSGSEPPPVEGSVNSITELNSGGVGSNPDYLSYYYNSVTGNPRMPPPILSKEDWGSRQKLGHDVNHCSETHFHLNPNNGCHTSDLVDSDNLVVALRGLNLCNDVSGINARRSFSGESRSLNPAHSHKSPFLVSSPSSSFPNFTSNSSRLFPDLIPTGNLLPLLENAVNAASSSSYSSSFASMSDLLYVERLKKLEYANLIEQSYIDTLWKMRQYSSQFCVNNGYNLKLPCPLKPVKRSDGIKDGFHSKRLKKFNINTAKRDLALSDIAGYVVDFSMDKFGSHFVQWKLETASVKEINMVFEEITPHALSLITNMFGNFVVQKFFECGSSQQIRELTSKLYSNVLHLSLQMHGCYIIQKAIEVVDLDQKVRLAAELNGHIMRCVKDQNGNHVIQKCIECIPEGAIQFIISSFRDRITTLSTHKYGFRIVKGVLEHCNDPNTHKMVIDEVMRCVRVLAWNRYGNCVLQHVVEHGKPEERSAIIKQLTGKIVRMSQQKYASIVVEKCLAFGSLEEREMLVKEMIGNTRGNEPLLQAMTKDQFGKYVVRKVLETCSDQQFRLVLSRMKAHLSVLKKGKHSKKAVSRVENLVATAERRNALQTYPRAWRDK